MELIAKTSCADRIIFLHNRDGDFYIEAEKFSKKEDIFTIEPVLINFSEVYNDLFSMSIIRHVWRTNEVLLVKQSDSYREFARDPYISEKQPLSVLFLPIPHNNNLIGILYLETYTLEIFSQSNIDILRIISIQAAFSMELARLHENLALAAKIFQKLIIQKENKKIPEPIITTTKKHLSIKEDFNYFLVSFEEIIYLYSDGKNTIVCTEKKNYTNNKLLKTILSELPTDNFFRVHKSYAVNIDMVSHLQY